MRPQRARRQLDWARMSARGLPVERSRSCRTRAPRHGCQPCLRESRPRAASRRHYPRVRVALVGDTHSSRAVRPTGACRAPATNAACIGGFEFEATMARPPPCFLTGQGGAYSRSARNRRFPPLPRPEQLRVEGSPLSRGRRDHCCSPMTRGPVTADGLAAPLRAARRRAAPPPRAAAAPRPAR